MLMISESGRASLLARLTAAEAGLADLTGPLRAVMEVVYEDVRQRFESRNDGEWPPLAEATVQRKAAQGMPEPDRPLYAEGNLFESATSPHGPHSVEYISPHQAMVGVDWTENGTQIPTVLAGGNDHLPARPIYVLDDALVAKLAETLRAGILGEALVLAA